MATSPIYSWPEPDNTDLVKNGALAIRTLGNAIDTTMGTMVAKTIVDAKGDLIAGTAADTAARLAVGANGETLVADSSTATGLRYQGSTAAGKNRIINGAMDFWQRSTLFGPSGASGIFTADRWTVTLTANTMTWSQETSIVPIGFQYSMKATSTGGGGSWFVQYIESQNCQDLAGKTVTLSAYCATSGSQSVDFIVYSNATFNANSGSAGWSAVSTTVVSTTATMPTTPQSGQFAIPANAKSLYVLIRSTGNLSSSATMAITGVQLELGSVATAFSRAGGTVQGELAACQRYYYRQNGISLFSRYTLGYATGATSANIIFPFPVTMRTAPSAVETTTASLYRVNDGITGTALTAFTIDQPTLQNCNLAVGVAAGLTQYRPYTLESNNSTATYLGFSAEL